MIAAPPDVIRWAPRSQGHGDCAIAAVSLACGVTYEVALAAALAFEPEVLTEGLSLKNIEKTVQQLGLTTKRRRKFELDEDTGILTIPGHAVYLWEGRILEPASSLCNLWLNAQAYLSHYKAKAGVLIEVTREE